MVHVKPLSVAIFGVAIACAGLGCSGRDAGADTGSAQNLTNSGNSGPHVHLGTENQAQTIDIDYTPTSTTVEGDSVTNFASNVSIALGGLAPNTNAVRAVVIDDCNDSATTESFQIVSQCDLAKEGSVFKVKVTASTCKLTLQPDNVDTGFPDVLVQRVTRPGNNIHCSQEIAVVADGTFLTDPINRTHNFKFQF
jgi:hypothetical protein